MIPHYFDWAATSPMSDRSLDIYVETAKTYRGNPSSLHKDGKDAARFLQQERNKTARLLGASSKQIIYTGGATESNAIVCNSLLWRRSPGRVIISAIEHDSILQYRHVLESKGFDVVFVPAPGGYVAPRDIAEKLTEHTNMVCVMLVNNVLGTVQDIKGIASAIRSFQATTGRPIHFHCDGVQGIGKMQVNVSSLDIDSASFSAHKFQGPRGTGILYQRGETLQPLSRGGGQEFGLRAGTEHVAAIAAMNAALEDTLSNLEHRIVHAANLRRVFEQELARFNTVSLISPPCDGPGEIVPNICTIAVDAIPSEVFTRILFDKGFCVSSGSACSNNTPKKGETLLAACQVSPDRASSAIRISFGHTTTEDEIRMLAQTIGKESQSMGRLTRRR